MLPKEQLQIKFNLKILIIVLLIITMVMSILSVELIKTNKNLKSTYEVTLKLYNISINNEFPLFNQVDGFYVNGFNCVYEDSTHGYNDTYIHESCHGLVSKNYDHFCKNN